MGKYNIWYTCDQCEKRRNDNGPYERADGEYECQTCMEGSVDAEVER